MPMTQRVPRLASCVEPMHRGTWVTPSATLAATSVTPTRDERHAAEHGEGCNNPVLVTECRVHRTAARPTEPATEQSAIARSNP
jgi:hypothetical protein